MARFALVLAVYAVAAGVGNVTAQRDMDKGIQMGTKTMQGVCWYEYLKVKPDKNPKSDKFGTCYVALSLNSTIASFEAQGVPRTDYATIKGSLGGSFNPFVKMNAPEQYSTCSEYIDDPEKPFGQDYSSVLNDGSGSYPFRGWAHCLVGQVEKTHGKESLDALKEKLSSAEHPWINEVFNRENENRARHGAPPTTLNKELTARAQRWADDLAKKCGPLTKDDHITSKHPDAFYEGKESGESIAQSAAVLTPEDSALQAANAWYEEVKDYPWPAFNVYDDATFSKIGHFTAAVWKGSQQVGYGLGKREGCDKTYVVARYWPGGNMPGQFADNVGPLSS